MLNVYLCHVAGQKYDRLLKSLLRSRVLDEDSVSDDETNERIDELCKSKNPNLTRIIVRDAIGALRTQIEDRNYFKDPFKLSYKKLLRRFTSYSTYFKELLVRIEGFRFSFFFNFCGIRRYTNTHL